MALARLEGPQFPGQHWQTGYFVLPVAMDSFLDPVEIQSKIYQKLFYVWVRFYPRPHYWVCWNSAEGFCSGSESCSWAGLLLPHSQGSFSGLSHPHSTVSSLRGLLLLHLKQVPLGLGRSPPLK